LYEYLTMVAGISPAEPGFKRVDITPHPATLDKIEASMPTPRGLIKLNWSQSGSAWSGSITLPKDVPGIFRWKGKTISLHPGYQKLEIEK